MDEAQNEQDKQVLTENTRLNKALDLDPRVVEYIVSLSPHEFQRLHNPLMRRLMAPRITLGRVAAMVHVPVGELLERVAALGGAAVEHSAASPSLPQSAREAPPWVTAADPTTVQTVDLLPLDEALNADPMLPVMVPLKALPPGGVLLIKHKWEPQPFYDVWSKMGDVEWFSEQIGPDEWWIWVRRLSR